MNQNQETEKKEQVAPAAEEHESNKFKAFLDRLTILHQVPHMPVRNWLAILGVILFIALVIAYYVVNGG